MNRLKELREELGWNMSETARRFELPYTTYVSYEKGARTPGFDLVCRMAERYDVSVTYLMGTSETRGSFPKQEESLAPEEGEADKAELIRIMSGLDPDGIAELLAHGRTLEALREARGNGPKSR